MKNICPKCNKKYLRKEYFGTPDSEGTIGRVVHSFKPIKTIFGNSVSPNEVCYLNQDQWNKIKG